MTTAPREPLDEGSVEDVDERYPDDGAGEGFPEEPNPDPETPDPVVPPPRTA